MIQGAVKNGLFQKQLLGNLDKGDYESEQFDKLTHFFERVECERIEFERIKLGYTNSNTNLKWIFSNQEKTIEIVAKDFNYDRFTWDQIFLLDGNLIEYGELIASFLAFNKSDVIYPTDGSLHTGGDKLTELLFESFLIARTVGELQKVLAKNWKSAVFEEKKRYYSSALTFDVTIGNGKLKGIIKKEGRHGIQFYQPFEQGNHLDMNLFNAEIQLTIIEELKTIGYDPPLGKYGALMEKAFVQEMKKRYENSKTYKLKKAFKPEELFSF